MNKKTLNKKASEMTRRRFLGANMTAGAALAIAPGFILGQQNVKLSGETNKKGIPDDEIWLLVRGDDIGASHSINMGFKKAIEDGILTSAEAMAPPSWFEEGVRILNEHPETDVGVHLTLTSESLLYRYGAISTKKASFLDENGYFFHRTVHDKEFDKIFDHSPYSFMGAKPVIREVEKELRSQIEMVMKSVSHVTHISTHMGAAVASPELKDLVERLGKEYSLVPVHKFERLFGQMSEIGMEGGNRFKFIPVPPDKKEEYLVSALKKLKPGIWHLVVHPGINTPELRAMNSGGGDFGEQIGPLRDAEANALTSAKVKEIIKNRKIKLVSHKDLIDKGLV